MASTPLHAVSPVSEEAPARPSTFSQGQVQRAWLEARFNAVRGWTLVVSLLGGIVATDLAVQHTYAQSAGGSAGSAQGPLAEAQTAPGGASLFRGQGDGSIGGSGAFLAPSPAAAGGPVRSSTS